nr:PHD finger protein 7-like [Anas platyrhynchos]
MAAALPPPECVLCHCSDTSLDGCGPMLKVDGVCAHVHCLLRGFAVFQYPAQGLYQRGPEGEGILGFRCADIRRVAGRAARKRCCVCRKKGATVACRQKRCSRRFHLPCSSQRGCISQFFGKYSSFCWEHRPQQTVETLQEGHTTCIICMEVVEDSLSYTTMVCPSCKHAWFHRGCIQALCVPHCRDWERFVPEMLQMGICVPNKPWQLLLCSSCAASGTHRRCSGLADTTQQWECAGCAGPGTGTGKGHGALRLGAAEPSMPSQGRTAKLGPLQARQGGQIC